MGQKMKVKSKEVIAVAFVVVIVMIALMGMASAATIIDHGTYEHFGFMSGPSNLKTDFKTSDSNAVSWVELEDEDIRSCEEFQQNAGWAWILPNGDYYSSHFTSSISMCEVRGGVVQGGTCVAFISIPEDIPGNWQVEFYYRGEKQFTDYFTIYSSILQSKIDAANPGDTILIEDGIYNDDYINVNKRLTIRSENGPSNCIVQAINPKAPVFEVSADYVNISGFTVKGADNGTRLFHADYCNISNNNFLYNDVGIFLSYSNNNTISGNNVSNNNHSIALYSSSNNHIYLNNFINNTDNLYSSKSTNIWNSPLEITYTYDGTTYKSYLGNYWDDYRGIDEDGIGDTPYQIDGDRDNYPLMELCEKYFALPMPGKWRGSAEFGEFVFIVNNSTGISKISYNFSNWTCGPTTRSGGVSISHTHWPITSGQFTIETDLGGTLPMTIRGKFDETCTHASGNWEAVSSGVTCSGAWDADYNSNEKSNT